MFAASIDNFSGRSKIDLFRVARTFAFTKESLMRFSIRK